MELSVKLALTCFLNINLGNARISKSKFKTIKRHFQIKNDCSHMEGAYFL